MARAEDIGFDCYSGWKDKKRRHALDQIRRLLAEMVHLKYQKSEVYDRHANSNVGSVLYHSEAIQEYSIRRSDEGEIYVEYASYYYLHR